MARMRASRPRRPRSRLPAGMAGLLALALVPVPALGGIDTTPSAPIEGTPTSVRVTDEDGNPLAGLAVEAVYRPGSEVSRTESLGTTDESGTVTWTPGAAGLVTLQTAAADGSAISRNLSVRFDGVPLPGLLTFLLAGIILFGGIIRGFRSLREAPPALPPDT